MERKFASGYFTLNSEALFALKLAAVRVLHRPAPGHADVLVRELPHLRRQQLRHDGRDPALVARAAGAGAQQTANLQPIAVN